MAASEYLRPGNLVETVKSYLTPDVVKNASSLVGEPESSTHRALQGAVPAMLGGLVNVSSTQEGASSLAGMIRDGGFAAALENPAALFSGGSMTSGMMSVGQSLIGKIFGNRASSVTEAVASSSGVKSSSVSSLMALLAPLTLGVVGKIAGSQGLNAAGISNLLQGQKRDIASAVPPGLSQVVDIGGGPRIAPSAPVAMYHEYEEKAASSARKWLPLLLIGLVALGLLWYFLLARAGSG